MIVGGFQLFDQFEWDLANPPESPEEFARAFAADLGLTGDFITAIAQQIREQVQVHLRSLTMVGYGFDGAPIPNEELAVSFLPPVENVRRTTADAELHTPALAQLTELEVELQERDRERDARKKKRQARGRRGAMGLPDRDPQKTIRTPAVYGWQTVAPDVLATLTGTTAERIGGGVSHLSRRAAAAAANAHLKESTPSSLEQMEETAKRTSRADDARVYFAHPGGLGRGGKGPSSDVAKGADQPERRSHRRLGAETLRTGPITSSATGTGSSATGSHKGPRVHPNIIEGHWHCANCGAPESVAKGQRKGPSGPKTLCLACGTVWATNKKLRAVEYSTDPEVHLALRAQRSGTVERPAKEVDSDYHDEPEDVEDGAGSRSQSGPHEASQPGQPANAPSLEPKSAPAKSEEITSPLRHSDKDKQPSPLEVKPSPSGAGGAQPSKQSSPTPGPVDPPEWLTRNLAGLRAQYPHDNFVPIMRGGKNSSTPEWRLRCLDCPGKLYTPGPAETLSNFEVHLKNRSHRANVTARLAK